MTDNTEHIISDFLLNPRKRVYRHLLLQLVVFLITINVFWDTPDALIITPARIRSWAGYFLAIDMLIYVNAYLLAPRYLLKGRLLPYLITALGLIVLAIVTIGTLQTLFDDTRFESMPANPSVAVLNIVSSTISCGLLVAGSSTLVLFKHWIVDNRRINELEAATLQSELKFLKSQINPHFLFNMLNNMYVLIRKERPEAADVVYRLEDLLRYQLNDSMQDKIRLSSDIRFMNDFLNLEKIRRDSFCFTITQEGNIDGVWLPPLLFIPFVENAVKHNTDSENTSFVHLRFRVQEHRLIFQCDNSKPVAEGDDDDKSARVGGLGLKNIKRRLELLYPNRHSLEIIDNKQSYTVKLELDI
ncbi:sensor histidine kinase [Parabacteroides bouchesdurhonensis]|uniref:sensor histidine kinase n=1 Tax=Parabacteroides bouchesdurhonensis TaxID=1936995 RepID=UPI000E487CD1|nr:histidine kinase [Parabacteroides bouchesdurhonensis]RHJ90228.1 GHKL domain-containing protein [Bacteroides sp. AM07-16]